MNNKLKKEIISHIFSTFGLLDGKDRLKSGLLLDRFLLDKKLTFEVDDRKFENKIWSAETKIDNSRVQVIIANLTDEVPEYCLLLQLDNFPPYIARISLDPEDAGSLYFKLNEDDLHSYGADMECKWIEASELYQAKILVAVISLGELLPNWIKNNDNTYIYKELIDFLKFESDNA